ncbi:hypothetical protein KY359_06740 [Candidatus Woesearchaeota archaeon]|nr:hypothetical protein [Candidatus Woesearchaeota archaeon]
MVFESLPKECIDEVVSCYRRVLDDETATPGKSGKMAFMLSVLENPDFLPQHLAEEIDRRRNGSSLAEYLFSHPQFRLTYGEYMH